MIHTLSERHLLPMSTPVTLLRCIGWVDLDQLSASTFRLARQLSKERRPRCITDRFRQTMSMNHPVHVQVFNADDTELIDNLSALLMGEVLSTPRDTLMYTSNDFAMLAPFRCAFSKFGVFTLDFSKRLFFLAEKTGILDFLSIRERCKGFQAYINPYGIDILSQAFRLYLARKRGIPFACIPPVDGECFDFAMYRAVVDHFDRANLGEAYPVIMRDAKTRLRKRERVIPILSSEARIAGVFTSLTAPEEGFKSQINAYRHVLQHLRMHTFEGWTFLFQDRKSFLLLIERKGYPLLLPSITTFFQQVIIQPATRFKRCFQCFHLFFIRIDSVLKHFAHGRIIAHIGTIVKWQGCHPIQATFKGRPIHPPGFSPDSYPHLFEVACQASRYRWGGETVKDCIGLRGRFTEPSGKMWVKDSHEWTGLSGLFL